MPYHDDGCDISGRDRPRTRDRDTCRWTHIITTSSRVHRRGGQKKETKARLTEAATQSICPFHSSGTMNIPLQVIAYCTMTCRCFFRITQNRSENGRRGHAGGRLNKPESWSRRCTRSPVASQQQAWRFDFSRTSGDRETPCRAQSRTRRQDGSELRCTSWSTIDRSRNDVTLHPRSRWGSTPHPWFATNRNHDRDDQNRANRVTIHAPRHRHHDSSCFSNSKPSGATSPPNPFFCSSL